jgi:hypothetical protein
MEVSSEVRRSHVFYSIANGTKYSYWNKSERKMRKCLSIWIWNPTALVQVSQQTRDEPGERSLKPFCSRSMHPGLIIRCEWVWHKLTAVFIMVARPILAIRSCRPHSASATGLRTRVAEISSRDPRYRHVTHVCWHNMTPAAQRLKRIPRIIWFSSLN